MSATQHIPSHVAIIMDGNGRWAKQRSQERTEGHVAGIRATKQVVKTAGKKGINHLSLYTFSTENWKRPQQEVDTLMNLLCKAILEEGEELIQNRVRVTFFGDRNQLPEAVRDAMEALEQGTAQQTGLQLHIALSYSSRWEITNTCRLLAEKVKNGELSAAQISEQMVSRHLTTRDIPDPDLLIRTGGELRLSNFLLWQLAYAEFYFTDVLWPNFSEEEFDKALHSYAQRERRFGKVLN